MLGQSRFSCIEKIKTTGATYMTASGLVTTDPSTQDNHHVLAVVEFALAIRSQLQVVNVHSFNNFQLRIGSSFFHYLFTCYLPTPEKKRRVSRERSLNQEKQRHWRLYTIQYTLCSEKNTHLCFQL